MQQSRLFFLFLFTILSQVGHAQYISRKDSGVFINEVYVYDIKTDKIRYKQKRPSREWIEIYNGLPVEIATRELYITDDKNEPFKWGLHVRKKKNRKIKKKGLLPVYINGTGHRKDVRINYAINHRPFYLVWYHHGDTIITDSLHVSAQHRYPLSRYPDGGKYTNTDALTPGFSNGSVKETESRKAIGINTQLGQATSSSEEFQNSTTPALAGAIGIYYTKTNPGVSMEYGVRYAIRGYGVDYQINTLTSRGVREINTLGRQTTHHFDFSYYLSNRVLKNFSIYYGGIFSVRVKSKLQYDQNITFTYFNSGQQIHNKESYTFTHYNSAVDFVDLSLAIGLRYHFREFFNISVYYVRDIAGINSNFLTSYGNQKNSGMYLVTEIPLSKSIVRVKNKIWAREIFK